MQANERGVWVATYGSSDFNKLEYEDMDLLSELECGEKLSGYETSSDLYFNEEVKDVEPIWKPTNPDFFEHYITMERYRIYRNSMDRQANISSMMRAILLDWIMEVCSEFTLKRATFHLSVEMIDRYLEINKEVKKEEFQLIGLAALCIACKAEVAFIAGNLCAQDQGFPEMLR